MSTRRQLPPSARPNCLKVLGRRPRPKHVVSRMFQCCDELSRASCRAVPIACRLGGNLPPSGSPSCLWVLRRLPRPMLVAPQTFQCCYAHHRADYCAVPIACPLRGNLPPSGSHSCMCGHQNPGRITNVTIRLPLMGWWGSAPDRALTCSDQALTVRSMFGPCSIHLHTALC